MTMMLPMLRRKGVCHPELCRSACCTFLLLEVNPVYLEPDLANWVRLHGIDLVEREGRVLARVPLPCSKLDHDGRCMLYGQPERPGICSDFPGTPASLFGVEGVCTYRFVEGPPA